MISTKNQRRGLMPEAAGRERKACEWRGNPADLTIVAAA
jgi:hypothetical protein